MPNAFALAELVATKAIAKRAGTITRRIVNSPWKKVSGRLLQRLSRNTSERPKTSFQALARHRSLTTRYLRLAGRSACGGASDRTPLQRSVHEQLSTLRVCGMRSFEKIYRLTLTTPLNLTTVPLDTPVPVMQASSFPWDRIPVKVYLSGNKMALLSNESFALEL
ncbi:MAG: hypothetical protein VX694_01350 [Planctomycetota bacterium]|nr:hypothetical protein [Planctomycetota bacterium]